MEITEALADAIGEALAYAVQASQDNDEDMRETRGYYDENDIKAAQAFTRKLTSTHEAFEAIRLRR